MTSHGTIHIVGAGLAGLAAALTSVRAGRRVIVWEATPRVGGRCRSWLDPAVGAVIDNGTHLALSGNHALSRYLAMIGATDRMETHHPAALPFIDLQSATRRDLQSATRRDPQSAGRWTLRPGPAMAWRADARPPGVSGLTLLRDVFRLLRADDQATVAAALTDSPALARLWGPLTVSALNARPEEGAASLLAAVARETLLRGEAACRPMLPIISLDDALIAPAVAALTAAGGELRRTARIAALERTENRITGLAGAGETLGPTDQVVLAVPAWVAGELAPELEPPPPGPVIVNAHFRADLGLPPLLGLTGGRADWLFQRAGVLSATVSAADDLAGLPAPEIAARIWAEAACAAGIDAPLPPYRIVKERTPTVSAAPAAQGRRPAPFTRWSNLFLAGDWTATGLPSTMEGAIRSGFAAAAALKG
jgi:hydroxysqualene dehydroxylase